MSTRRRARASPTREKTTTEEDADACRFCFESAREDDPLIAPCACRGGQEYIHAKCLLRWQRMVVVQAPTHPAFWNEDTRSNVCNVCKEAFTTPPPTRMTLMSSFTGAEIAAMCAVGHLLVSHAAFSAKLREKLQDMNPAMRRICSYEYWIEGTYLITETRASSDEAGESSEGDVGDDTIVAVNLNGRCDVSEVVQGESRLFEIVGAGGPREASASEPRAGRQVRVRLRQEFEEGNDDDDDNDDDNDDDERNTADVDDADVTNEDADEDDLPRDEIADDAEQTPELVIEVPEGVADDREAFFEHLQQLLSPFGPIFEVYQRFRRRRVIEDAYDEVAREWRVTRQDVENAVEIELFDGGPCDHDEVALCIVVGTDTSCGYTKVEGSLAGAISVAFRNSRAYDGSSDGLRAGGVVKCAATADVREAVGVLCGFSEESNTWNVASPFGVLKRTREEFEVLRSPTRAKVLCFFGTAQWNRSQLLGEIARGHWGLTKSEPVDVARAETAYRRAMDSGSLVFAPLTEMTEEFMRDELAEMSRIRSSGQLDRAGSSASH